MKNIQKLIDETLSFGIEAAKAGDKDMAKAYADDYCDFIDIRYLVQRGYTGAAAKDLSEMDTEPREAFVLAMLADGIDIEKYGFVAN